MKKSPYLFLAACVVVVAAFSLINFIKNPKDHTGKEDSGMVFVALQPVQGLTVKSENPVSVKSGSDVSFEIALSESVYLKDSSRYTYKDGVVTFPSVYSDCTMYLDLEQYFSLTVRTEGAGSFVSDRTDFLKKGDVSTVRVLPEDGYFLSTIKVNGTYIFVEETDTYTIQIDKDTVMDICFEPIPAPPQTTFSVFLSDRDNIPEYMDLDPGTTITLPLGDVDEMTMGDYAIIGYNTAPDFTGKHYSLGSMLTVGDEDITLYPEKIKYADAADFTGRVVNSRYLITGYTGTPENGMVCIPPYINGVPVTDILHDSFSGIEGLISVVFPVGMRKIDTATFRNCPDFTTVYLPETLESITPRFVAECDSFSTVQMLATSRQVFTISFDAGLADKFIRLMNTEGKRIIVIGGSSVSFGLSSQLLADTFPDYEIIDFGGSYLHGIMPQLQLLQNYIHQGDILIFAPEYYFSTHCASDQETISIWHSVESNYNMLSYFDARTYNAFITSLPEYLRVKRQSIATNTPAFYTAELLNREHYNFYGDLASVRPANNTKKISTINTAIINQYGMNRFNAYLDDFTEKGATCLFSFPPIYTGVPSAALKQAAQTHLNNLTTYLTPNCTVISTPEEYMFTENLFYDNAYHCTLEGATRRTELLIEDLKRFLQR